MNYTHIHTVRATNIHTSNVKLCKSSFITTFTVIEFIRIKVGCAWFLSFCDFFFNLFGISLLGWFQWSAVEKKWHYMNDMNECSVGLSLLFDIKKAKNHFSSFFLIFALMTWIPKLTEKNTISHVSLFCVSSHTSYSLSVSRSSHCGILFHAAVFYSFWGQIDDSDFPCVLHTRRVQNSQLLRFMLKQFSIYCFSMKFTFRKKTRKKCQREKMVQSKKESDNISRVVW